MIKKVYEFIRYDIPNGIKNLIFFFSVVWVFHDWDYVFCLALFGFSLRRLQKRLKNGMEIEETRMPKVQAIENVLCILDHIINSNYLELAQKELGCEYNISYPIGEEPKEVEDSNGKISNRSRVLEETEWKFLKDILFGDDEIKGSDMRGWWD